MILGTGVQIVHNGLNGRMIMKRGVVMTVPQQESCVINVEVKKIILTVKKKVVINLVIKYVIFSASKTSKS